MTMLWCVYEMLYCGCVGEDVSNVPRVFSHVLQAEWGPGNKAVCVCGVLAVV